MDPENLTSPPESNFVYTGWSGISKSSNSKVSIPELSSLPKGKCLLSPRLEGPVSRSFWSQGPPTQRSAITPYRIVLGNIKRQVLFPVAVTFFITWWFIQFVDGFFSPLYEQLGIEIFGLGFIASLLFVFFVGVFVSSWMGATVFSLGEWIIKKMPFVKHIYSASKQISSAISPDQNTTAFKEVAIIRHPRVGEYAFGFITSTVTLQRDNEDEELCSVFVPTNHLYIGDIFLVNSKDIIRPNLSIREGIEIIVSGGMTMPQIISPQERVTQQSDKIPLNRIK